MLKVTAVNANNRKRVFEVELEDGRALPFPYARCEPEPTPANAIADLFIDPEVGMAGFTYVLRSGEDGVVLSDWVLELNRDPSYLKDLLLYRFSTEARRRFEESGLGVRHVARALCTSPAQVYRILDQTNHGKSLDQVVMLLTVLGYDTDFTVRPGKGLARAQGHGAESEVGAEARGPREEVGT